MATGTEKVDKAIRAARRIRRNLIKSGQWSTDLGGACGLASILLSIAVNDVGILRRRRDHVWTEVNKVIIDITATQFSTEEDLVRGVLISKHRTRSYHKNIIERGLTVYLSIVNHNWYTKRDHPRWGWISEYWL